MTREKIRLDIEYGKIVGALCMAGTFLYYAGKLDQKVADHDTAITKMKQDIKEIQNQRLSSWKK